MNILNKCVMKFESSIKGVILNDNELSKEEIIQLEKDGYFVLSTDEEIEIEDYDTGELKIGKITITNDEFFLFDEYDDYGNIISECEIPLITYLYQLEEYGALDNYNIELD